MKKKKLEKKSKIEVHDLEASGVEDMTSELSTSMQGGKKKKDPSNRWSLKLKGSKMDKSFTEDDEMDQSEVSKSGKKRHSMSIKSLTKAEDDKSERSSSHKFKLSMKNLHIPGSKTKNKDDQSPREDDKEEKKIKIFQKENAHPKEIANGRSKRRGDSRSIGTRTYRFIR